MFSVWVYIYTGNAHLTNLVPDDILDAAQKAINDAAKTADTGAVPAAPLNETPPPQNTPLPPEPVEPVIPLPTETSSVPITPEPVPPSPVSTDMSKEEIMNELLGATSIAAPASVIVPPEKTEKPHGGGLPPKKSSKAAIVAVIAALLLTLPVAVYFISQQSGSIADIRNRATDNAPYPCDPNSSNAVNGYCDPGQGEACDSDSDCGGDQICHCQGGQQCEYSVCVSESYFITACEGDGRDPSHNSGNPGSWTCCAEGYVAGPNQQGCYPSNSGGGDDDDSGDDDDTPPNPTPTTGTSPVCQNIKIYKNGTQVTDLSTLNAGDEVVLAVKGNLAPTKAHFRVNGGAWTETTTKNASNEFTLSYTIPTGVPDFVIEGEVFTNGAWR